MVPTIWPRRMFRYLPSEQQGQWSLREDIGIFSSCAVVFSSGFLVNSSLGSTIDSHESVIRFNDAPAGEEFARDVGSRTTFRVIGPDGAGKVVNQTRNMAADEGFICRLRDEELVHALRHKFPTTKMYRTYRAYSKEILQNYLSDLIDVRKVAISKDSFTTVKPTVGESLFGSQ